MSNSTEHQYQPVGIPANRAEWNATLYQFSRIHWFEWFWQPIQNKILNCQIAAIPDEKVAQCWAFSNIAILRSRRLRVGLAVRIYSNCRVGGDSGSAKDDSDCLTNVVDKQIGVTTEPFESAGRPDSWTNLVANCVMLQEVTLVMRMKVLMKMRKAAKFEFNKKN